MERRLFLFYDNNKQHYDGNKMNDDMFYAEFSENYKYKF